MTRFDDAEATYGTWLLFNEGTAAADFVGTRDLVRFVADPDFELTPAQSAALFANPRVRASYRGLLERFSVATVPIVAAASDGDVEERVFAGARVVLSPSVREPEYYLRFELEPWLADGSVVLLGRDVVDVPLHWMRWRIDSRVLDRLGEAVTTGARAALRRPRAGADDGARKA